MRLPKMYQEITLQDGRKCTVIDYMEDGEFFECGEDGKVYNICPRKGIEVFLDYDFLQE